MDFSFDGALFSDYLKKAYEYPLNTENPSKHSVCTCTAKVNNLVGPSCQVCYFWQDGKTMFMPLLCILPMIFCMKRNHHYLNESFIGN